MKKKSIIFLTLMMVFFAACNKEAGYDHDEEVITTLSLQFTPQSGGPSTVFSFDDPDGPGGIDPVIETIQLAPNTVYNVSLKLYNKTLNPAEDLTVEVEAESEAHRLYYEPSPASNISISGLDNDVDGIPLGLHSVWTTGTTANGSIQITLRHYGGNPPNKAVDDPVNSIKSSTDADVLFTTKIQ